MFSCGNPSASQTPLPGVGGSQLISNIQEFLVLFKDTLTLQEVGAKEPSNYQSTSTSWAVGHTKPHSSSRSHGLHHYDGIMDMIL